MLFFSVILLELFEYFNKDLVGKSPPTEKSRLRYVSLLAEALHLVPSGGAKPKRPELGLYHSSP